MDNKNIDCTKKYADILQRINALYNLTLPDIKNRYADYPHCVMDYFENGEEDKSIEIRFDQEKLTITYTFDSDEVCDCIMLFADEEGTIHELIPYLGKLYDYDFILTRWIAPGCYISIKRLTQSICDICFMFRSKS